jgi:hypothetical protein
VSVLKVFKGVLRIASLNEGNVQEDKQDTESIDSTQFFLKLVENIKNREEGIESEIDAFPKAR